MMDRVRQVVRRSLRSPKLGVDLICREAYASRSQVYRLLQGEGGVARYIQKLRLSEGFALLCDGSRRDTIETIAEQLCFSDASTFARAFRREFGVSPSDVRAAAQTGLSPAAMGRADESAGGTFADCLRGF
jgi:AraC-like DNA-binding protein